jgi:hypothetical protein
MVTQSKSDIQDSQILEAAVRNLVDMATWCEGCVDLCYYYYYYYHYY